jgi:hypothetical protein
LTWNEIDGCRQDVPRLPLDQFEEVYAIDGGSTDGTCEYLTSLGIAVYRQDSPGYNAAYLSAFRRCTTDALLMFHPKGSVDPATVLQVRPLLERGADLVIASRLIAGGANEEDDRLLSPASGSSSRWASSPACCGTEGGGQFETCFTDTGPCGATRSSPSRHWRRASRWISRWWLAPTRSASGRSSFP